MRIKTRYIDADCAVSKLNYSNGRIALQLKDAVTGELLCTASTNLPDAPCTPGCTYIKDYSENEGVLDALVMAGIVSKPLAIQRSGFVDIPLCKVLI